MFGSGCYPLEFPDSLRGLLSEIRPADTIIPGHGPVVDRSFAIAQLTDITTLATRLRALHRSEATQHQAFTAIQAVPSLRVDGLELAVAKAYSSLDGWPAPARRPPASHRRSEAEGNAFAVNLAERSELDLTRSGRPPNQQ
jgi:hypothetical protein